MPYFPPNLLAGGSLAGAINQKQDFQQGITFTGVKSTPGTRESFIFDSTQIVTFSYAAQATALKAALDGIMLFTGAGGSASNVWGLNFDLRVTSTGGHGNLGSYNPCIGGINVLARTLSGFSGTVSGEVVAGQFQVRHSAGAGTLAGAIVGVQIAAPSFAAGGTVSGAVYGVRIGNQGNAGWTNSYGLYIDTQSGSTNPHAIKVVSGIVDLGGGNFGALGATPAAQQAGGSKTAAGTYGANEQDMLQKAYNALRTFGFLA